MVGGRGEAKTSRTFIESASHFLYFLPVYLSSTYFFTQILLPKFLFKRRYIAFAFSFIVLFIINFAAIYYAGLLYLSDITGKSIDQITFDANKYHAIVDGLFVPFMLFGIVAGIKFSKKWFLQQKENERLAKQKLATELQILKTSIHPRFLFHSLHTVEKYINSLSVQSPALILQLSDMLSYILYENDKNWSSLEKELEIVRSYINLEEKGFKKRALLKTKFPESAQDTFITPCILLSLVEVAFEHFHESGQEEPKFDLSISSLDHILNYQMFFSKRGNMIFGEKEMENIRRQLENQYAGLYQLEIRAEDTGIRIHLKLPLYARELINLKKETIVNEAPLLV